MKASKLKMTESAVIAELGQGGCWPKASMTLAPTPLPAVFHGGHTPRLEGGRGQTALRGWDARHAQVRVS